MEANVFPLAYGEGIKSDRDGNGAISDERSFK